MLQLQPVTLICYAYDNNVTDSISIMHEYTCISMLRRIESLEL